VPHSPGPAPPGPASAVRPQVVPAPAVPPPGGLPQPGPSQAGQPGSAAWTANQVPADPATLDQLAHRLYGRIRSQLAAELLADRERAHLLTDL
jgi:hypothetical protein